MHMAFYDSHQMYIPNTLCTSTVTWKITHISGGISLLPIADIAVSVRLFILIKDTCVCVSVEMQ